MLNVAHGLTDQGVAVDIVAAWGGGGLRREVPDRVGVVDLRSRRASFALPGLIRYLRRVRPRSLLACDHGNVVALWAQRLAGGPTRVVVSEHSRYTGNRARRGDWRARVVACLAGSHYQFADGIIAVSAGVAEDVEALTRLPRERIEVIHNPIRLDRIQTMASEPPEHPWLDDPAVPLVLGVGRLAPEKDFQTLIRAFMLVQSARPVRLAILGEGPERARLERLVARIGAGERVALPGVVTNPFAWMARAAVLALSSVTEGLPQVLVEALACGCPVVATDCPSGPQEILQGGKFGTLVPMADPQALATAIVDAIDRPLPRACLTARAADFAMDRIIRRYRAVLLDEGPADGH